MCQDGIERGSRRSRVQSRRWRDKRFNYSMGSESGSFLIMDISEWFFLERMAARFFMSEICKKIHSIPIPIPTPMKYYSFKQSTMNNLPADGGPAQPSFRKTELRRGTRRREEIKIMRGWIQDIIPLKSMICKMLYFFILCP